MQCRAVGSSQVDMKSAWTIKYTLRVSLKISCLQSIYMVVISAKYSLRAFSSLQLNWDMKCILIGKEHSQCSGNTEMCWQYSLFCVFTLDEMSEVRSALE